MVESRVEWLELVRRSTMPRALPKRVEIVVP